MIPLCIQSRIFRRIQSKIFPIYIKKINYFLIKIHKNIFEIDTLFFYENPKLIPQGGPFAFIPEFFDGIKVNFFSLYMKMNSVFVLKVFILPRVAELFIHKEKQRGCRLLGASLRNYSLKQINNIYTHI